MLVDIEHEVVTALHIQTLTREHKTAELSPGFTTNRPGKRGTEVGDPAARVENKGALVAAHFSAHRHHVCAAGMRLEMKNGDWPGTRLSEN